NDLDSHVRAAVACSLSSIAIREPLLIPKIFNWLGTLVRDDDWFVRGNVAYGLGHIPIPEAWLPAALEWLSILVKDVDYCRLGVARTLGRMPIPELYYPLVFELISTLVKDQDEHISQ